MFLQQTNHIRQTLVALHQVDKINTFISVTFLLVDFCLACSLHKHETCSKCLLTMHDLQSLGIIYCLLYLYSSAVKLNFSSEEHMQPRLAQYHMVYHQVFFLDNSQMRITTRCSYVAYMKMIAGFAKKSTAVLPFSNLNLRSNNPRPHSSCSFMLNLI